jgi:putative hydrolase of the HAD superfamily
MTRAVLFDFDQTLVEFPPADPRTLFEEGASRCYAFLSAHDRSLPTFEAFCRRHRWLRLRYRWMTRLTGGEADMRPFLRRICKDFGLQRDQASLATLGWAWYEPIAEKATLAPDVRPTLTALTAAGIELGLVINSAHPAGVIDQHLDQLKLLEFFPTRAYSTEIGAHKPDAQLFSAALNSIGASASEAIYVGDEIRSDILGAHRVGIRTVLLSRNVISKPPAADYMIRDLAQLLDLPELAQVQSKTRPAAPVIPALIV